MHTTPVTTSTTPRRSGRLVRSAATVAAMTVGLTLASAAPAAAHERWFVDGTAGGDWSFFFSPLPLLLVAVAVVATVLWRAAARRLPSPELPVLRPIGRLVPFIPRLLALHLGISLLALALGGALLAHSAELPDTGTGLTIVLAEGALGAWFITGIHIRAAAIGLVALGPVVLAVSGPVALLESAGLVGIAGFLIVVPPTNTPLGRVTADAARLRLALLALRVGVAVALITLAFSEKFTNPQLATSTLETYPALDVLSLVGIHLDHDTFIAIAGAIELLFGLLVLSGGLPQVAVLVAAVPFNATLILFGQTELIGHLPVYGVFLTLLAYGSNPGTAQLVPWLPRRAAHEVAPPVPAPAAATA